jgi:hypothetical protein
MRPIGWCVEHHNPKLACVECRAGAASYGLIQRVRVVRDEHQSRVAMLATGSVDEKQPGRPRARTQHLLCRFQKGADLGIAVGRPLDRVAVNAERDIVEEQPAVYLRHVDPALDPAAERIERAGHVLPVHAHVEREVVARPRGNAHERELVRGGRSGYDGQGAITPSHTEGICAAGYRCLSERCQVVARGQDDNFDTLLARPLRNPGARGRAPAGPRIDKQHRLSRPADGAPATTQQLALGSFSPHCGLSS